MVGDLPVVHGCVLGCSRTHLRLPCVQVGLDENLAQADVLADSGQGLLHGLACSQDGDAGDLGKGHGHVLGAPRVCQPQELCTHREQGAGIVSHPLPVEPLPLVHRALGCLHSDRLQKGEHSECGGSQTHVTGGTHEGR